MKRKAMLFNNWNKEGDAELVTVLHIGTVADEDGSYIAASVERDDGEVTEVKHDRLWFIGEEPEPVEDEDCELKKLMLSEEGKYALFHAIACASGRELEVRPPDEKETAAGAEIAKRLFMEFFIR